MAPGPHKGRGRDREGMGRLSIKKDPAKLKYELLCLSQCNPHMPYTDMANKFGVSSVRVGQILGNRGKRGRAIRRFCRVCGNPVYIRRSLTAYRQYLCSDCYTPYKAHRVELVCEICNQPFTRKESEMRQAINHGYRRRFCSNECKGRWLGRTHSHGKRRELVAPQC